MRDVGTEEFDRDHERGVLHQDARVAMVRMVVVRAVAHDDVGLPLADQPDEGLAVLQRRHQLAVVDVEHLGLDAQDFGGGLDLGGAAFGQRAAGHLGVPDVPVGRGDELDAMAPGGPQGGGPPRFQLAIVRVGPEDDDMELSIVASRGRVGPVARRERQQHEQGRHGRGQGCGCSGQVFSGSHD